MHIVGIKNPIEPDFINAIKDILTNEHVLQMKKFIQHGNTTCYQHCLNVAYYNYRLCKVFSLNWKAGARAGMLHDFFLYDWHSMGKGRYYHGFRHPAKALSNAKEIFSLSSTEKDMILNHMFPLTIYRIPKYRETYIITLSDKLCCALEFFSYYNPKKLLMRRVTVH